MQAYEVDYSYSVKEGGVEIINATSTDEAEAKTLVYLKETFPDVTNIQIESVKVINA